MGSRNQPAMMSVEDIERALQDQPLSRFQRIVVSQEWNLTDSIAAGFLGQVFPHRLWLQAIPSHTIRNDEPHVLPEEVRP